MNIHIHLEKSIVIDAHNKKYCGVGTEDGTCPFFEGAPGKEACGLEARTFLKKRKLVKKTVFFRTGECRRSEDNYLEWVNNVLP